MGAVAPRLMRSAVSVAVVTGEAAGFSALGTIDRLAFSEDALNRRTAYTYDPNGNRTSFVNRAGQTTVDMANSPEQRTQPFPETIALLESLGAREIPRRAFLARGAATLLSVDSIGIEHPDQEPKPK